MLDEILIYLYLGVPFWLHIGLIVCIIGLGLFTYSMIRIHIFGDDGIFDDHLLITTFVGMMALFLTPFVFIGIDHYDNQRHFQQCVETFEYSNSHAEAEVICENLDTFEGESLR